MNITTITPLSPSVWLDFLGVMLGFGTAIAYLLLTHRHNLKRSILVCHSIMILTCIGLFGFKSSHQIISVDRMWLTKNDEFYLTKKGTYRNSDLSKLSDATSIGIYPKLNGYVKKFGENQYAQMKVADHQKFLVWFKKLQATREDYKDVLLFQFNTMPLAEFTKVTESVGLKPLISSEPPAHTVFYLSL